VIQLLKFLLLAVSLIAGLWLVFSPIFDFLFGIFPALFSPLDFGSRVVGGLILLFFAYLLKG